MLEETLKELEVRRLGYKDRREKIEEELRARRISLLAEEQAQIEDLIAKAYASGATLGQIKKAYGTKDHRTITTIVANRAAEIKYWREALSDPTGGAWFTIMDDGQILIRDVVFEATPLDDGKVMLITTEPKWNDDYTIENETVREFDGKTEEDDERISEIAEALRNRN